MRTVLGEVAMRSGPPDQCWLACSGPVRLGRWKRGILELAGPMRTSLQRGWWWQRLAVSDLPRVRDLASTILSLCERQLPTDWESVYSHWFGDAGRRPVSQHFQKAMRVKALKSPVVHRRGLPRPMRSECNLQLVVNNSRFSCFARFASGR
jgi:hypothetical protein